MTARDEQGRFTSAGRHTPIERHLFGDFHGGWHPEKSVSQLLENEITDVQNLEYEAGGGVRKRGGFVEYTDAVAGLDNIDFFYAPRVYTVSGLVPLLGQRVFAIAKNDGEIYSALFSDLEDDFAGGADGNLVDTTYNMGPASAGAFNHFRVWPIHVVTFEDKIYITCLRYSGEDNGVTTNATEDGTATGATRPLRYDAQAGTYSRMVVADLEDGATTSPRFPRARCAIAYHDRMFAANVHSQGDFRFPSRIYWSEPGDAETWETSSWIAVAQDDGTEITALQPMGEQILIFKNNSVFSLVGTDEDTFALYPLSNRLGTEATFGTTEGDGVAYFWDHGSMTLYQYDGARFDDIGQPVSEYVRQNINYNAMHKMLVQKFDNYVWVSFPTGSFASSENDKNRQTVVYDTLTKAWTKWTFGVAPMVQHRYSDFQTNGLGDTIEGDANPYFVYTHDDQDDHIMKGFMGNPDTDANTTWTDNGTNFTWQFRTAYMSPDHGMERKRIRKVEFLVTQLSDQIDVDLYRDFINSAWTEFSFDALADTDNDIEWHLKESVVDVTGLFNWLAFDITATHANEAQINSIGVRYSYRPSPRGDVAGSQYGD